MPWKELSKMDEKVRFIADWLSGKETMTSLCVRYGISRETGSLWKRRYLEEGASGLEERSRAPIRHGRLTEEAIADRIAALRRKRPFWGAKKLLKVLSDEYPSIAWPARSTVTDILKRAGLVQPRRKRHRGVAVEQPFGEIAAANDSWCIDFKGWFRTRDGERCDPLTVTDAFSRYLLCCKIMPEQTVPVRQAVDRTRRSRLKRSSHLLLPRASSKGVLIASAKTSIASDRTKPWARKSLQAIIGHRRGPCRRAFPSLGMTPTTKSGRSARMATFAGTEPWSLSRKR